ncbi:hypothetical protein JW756_04205 [Candidatus Woesearchaeota archaeon]|nr:hypothetical protein [Candidatus Woesearchaeota archaeon]
MDYLHGEIELRQRLKRKKALFFRTRDLLSVTPAVGLAVFPRLHNSYASGCIVKLMKNKRGVYFSMPSLLDYETIYLKPEDKEKILVEPDFKFKDPRLISVFQWKGLSENRFEERLLSCADDVMIGLYGHELAHWVDSNKKMPDNFRKDLDKIVKSVTENQYFHCEDDVKVDLIAARYGLKKAVLAKIDYMIGCLSSYPSPGSKSFFARKPREVMIELERRKEAVKKYS